MAHDVFLSHTHADAKAAEGVCQALEARGIKCWIAPRDVRPGADWQQSIMDAIANARAMVLIFSSHTNTSEHVKREVSVAGDAGAVIIPFRIENVSPEGALRYNLNRVQWLDAYNPPMDMHIDELVRTLSTISPGADDDTTATASDAAAKAAEAAAATAAAAAAAHGRSAAHEQQHSSQPITVEVPNVVAAWSGASSDRKVAVGLGALLAVVLVGFGVNALLHKKGSNNNSAAPASSSLPVQSGASSGPQVSSTPAADPNADILPASYDRHVIVVNDTDSRIDHFYASNSTVNGWGGEDLLGSAGTIAVNGHEKLNFDDGTGHCLFDFKAVFADGQQSTAANVDVCRVLTYHFMMSGSQQNRTVTIHNATESPLTHFYASNINASNWGGQDLLGSQGPIQAHGELKIDITDGTNGCRFDLKANFADGTTQTEHSVDACHVGTFEFIK